MGRDINIFAGFKHIAIKKKDSTAADDGKISTNLFDMIEEVEEIPVDTPL